LIFPAQAIEDSGVGCRYENERRALEGFQVFTFRIAASRSQIFKRCWGETEADLGEFGNAAWTNQGGFGATAALFQALTDPMAMSMTVGVNAEAPTIVRKKAQDNAKKAGERKKSKHEKKEHRKKAKKKAQSSSSSSSSSTGSSSSSNGIYQVQNIFAKFSLQDYNMISDSSGATSSSVSSRGGLRGNRRTGADYWLK